MSSWRPGTARRGSLHWLAASKDAGGAWTLEKVQSHRFQRPPARSHEASEQYELNEHYELNERDELEELEELEEQGDERLGANPRQRRRRSAAPQLARSTAMMRHCATTRDTQQF